jgi:hypothetical protein
MNKIAKISLITFILVFFTSSYSQEQFDFGERYAVIIAGIGGQDHYSEQFYNQGKRMYDILVFELSYSTQNVILLAEDPSMDPDRIQGVATTTAIRKVFSNLQNRMRPQDQLFVFLVGHGSYDGISAKFNIAGPDLRDLDYAEIAADLPCKRLIFVNCSSASGPFIDRLSGSERIIITATKNGYENNETTFADFFMDALLSPEGDVDKDDRVSILEAFNLANVSQENKYEENRQIRVEHPLIDDNGDGKGSQKDAGTEDGVWAARTYLGPVSVEVQESLHRVRSGTQSRLDELRLEKAGLEIEIEDLKARKPDMQATEYAKQLETLLIRMARISKEMKQLEQDQ